MHLAVFDMKQLGKKNHNKVRLCFLLNIYLIIRFSVPSKNVTARKVSTKWCIFVTPGAVKQMISFWFVNMFYVNTALSLNISYITYDRSEVYCHLTEKKQRSEFFFSRILFKICLFLSLPHSLFLSQTAQTPLPVFLLASNSFVFGKWS